MQNTDEYKIRTNERFVRFAIRVYLFMLTFSSMPLGYKTEEIER